MTTTYTFDIFATLDGFGSYGPDGDRGGYWGKQGPELLAHRLALYGPEQQMVLGANMALMAAGLVDRVQVTVFPVITGKTGLRPIFEGAADFDLELIETRTLDGHTQEFIYRPTVH